MNVVLRPTTIAGDLLLNDIWVTHEGRNPNPGRETPATVARRV
jgi:hypothetical protein